MPQGKHGTVMSFPFCFFFFLLLVCHIDVKSHECSPVSHDAGVPARRPLEVPPRSWIDSMRTPAADLILLEFHRQKYSTEGEAEGQENTSPNSAFYPDPSPHPQPASPNSGLLRYHAGLCHYAVTIKSEKSCIMGMCGCV